MERDRRLTGSLRGQSVSETRPSPPRPRKGLADSDHSHRPSQSHQKRSPPTRCGRPKRSSGLSCNGTRDRRKRDPSLLASDICIQTRCFPVTFDPPDPSKAALSQAKAMLPDGGGVTTKCDACEWRPRKTSISGSRGRAARKHHVERTLDLSQLAVESELFVKPSPQAGKERVDQRGQAERRRVDVCGGLRGERVSTVLDRPRKRETRKVLPMRTLATSAARMQ